MTRECACPGLRITQRIADSAKKSARGQIWWGGLDPDDATMTVRERWTAWLLDLERLTLAERLIRVSDMFEHDVRHLWPTVYLHVLDGRLQYVGKSNNVSYRRITHRRDGMLWDDEYVLLPPVDMLDGADIGWMDAVEAALISYLDPPANTRNSYAAGAHRVFAHLEEHGFRMPNGVRTRRD